MCVWAPSRKIRVHKESICIEISCDWDLQNPGEKFLVSVTITNISGDGWLVLRGYRFGKKNVEKRRLLEFCDKKEMSVANTWYENEE